MLKRETTDDGPQTADGAMVRLVVYDFEIEMDHRRRTADRRRVIIASSVFVDL